MLPGTGSAYGQGEGMWGVQGCGPQNSERQLQQLRCPQRGSRFGAGTNICLSALCPLQGLQKQHLCPLQTQTNLAKVSQSRCSGMKSQDALQDEHAPSVRSGAWAAGATGGVGILFYTDSWAGATLISGTTCCKGTKLYAEEENR